MKTPVRIYWSICEVFSLLILRLVWPRLSGAEYTASTPTSLLNYVKRLPRLKHLAIDSCDFSAVEPERVRRMSAILQFDHGLTSFHFLCRDSRQNFLLKTDFHKVKEIMLLFSDSVAKLCVDSWVFVRPSYHFTPTADSLASFRHEPSCSANISTASILTPSPRSSSMSFPARTCRRNHRFLHPLPPPHTPLPIPNVSTSYGVSSERHVQLVSLDVQLPTQPRFPRQEKPFCPRVCRRVVCRRVRSGGGSISIEGWKSWRCCIRT
ncbi:hypothetical protein GYMLUDRAFT_407169 [Collybiopsis luxurians FD-317 M1]|uniref:Uncharacterized protein n=1 Tax=Collybiopsis luxurians FD-317 M1 TaxID=944289 RepID=A0A0D0ALN8_9AGAR|nr:hypothetical protein GYMLUDRAFT_407169 [Collybiopsis luxurians FD-317 M1]